MRFYITPEFHIATTLLRFDLQQQSGRRHPQLRAVPGAATLLLPTDFAFADRTKQSWLRRVVAEALRQQCRWLLAPRVHALAQRHALQFNRIVFKDISSRWGSCSSLKNLNFSVWLLLAPVELVDYVLCHELAHLREMNHSVAFWNEVDRLLEQKGEGKRRDRAMNRFSQQLPLAQYECNEQLRLSMSRKNRIFAPFFSIFNN